MNQPLSPKAIREIREGTCNPLGAPQVTTDLSENFTGVNVEQPILNLEQNRFECRSCGYIYDPSEGNKKLNIPKNTPFSDLDGYTFACPVCRACLLYTSPSPRD